MRLPRASGILLHPSSLPGRFGIGDLGPEAVEFLDFLDDTGQHWWQMLPVGPIGHGHSPYQSPSSFAGNPLLLSPDRMAEEGWISARDWSHDPTLSTDRVVFDAIIPAKRALLERAYRGFGSGDSTFETYCRDNARWLDDFALFMAAKEAHDGRIWADWEHDLARREPAAMTSWRDRLADRVRFHQFTQFAFDRQWCRLREEAGRRRIRLVGDLPIFVSHDSADVWARPDLFRLGEDLWPSYVAGVPPDYFSETGQLWGNPVYQWSAHVEEGFAWWIDRLRASLMRADLVRIDHFRGFAAYWEVPGDAPTAATGQWTRSPGVALFEAAREALGGLPFIAEDLGEITPDVEALRDQFDLPGMRVLQFAFSVDPKAADYRPYSYPNHCVVYTGTHDNDTTVGWFTTTASQTTQTPEQIAEERAFIRRYLGTTGKEIHWDLIRLALGSVADTAIVPMQDLLGLGSEARMNLPGMAEGNWAWRYRSDQITRAVRDRLADLTAVYGRWNGEVAGPSRASSEGGTLTIVGDQQGDGKGLEQVAEGQ